MDDLHKLEPGCDENPLEWAEEIQATYNPFRYTYPMPCQTEQGPIEITVQFLVDQLTTPRDDIKFKAGDKEFNIPFFFDLSHPHLEPISDPTAPELESGYQIGERRYRVIPAIVRARTIIEQDYIPGFQPDDGACKLLDRATVKSLVSPELLLRTIREYRERVSCDPNAPTALLELLDQFSESWDTDNQNEDEDDWNDEEEDDDWDDEDDDDDDSERWSNPLDDED